MPFELRIRENSHYRDESEAYDHGSFATYAEAEAACRKIVDEYLASARKSGMSADDLFRSYTMFGEDPAIDAAGPNGERFSAWDYARRRCRESCERAAPTISSPPSNSSSAARRASAVRRRR